MISVSNLSKDYNGVTVLNIDNLDIPTGESFGLVGNNGAGKTTFFSLLLDLIQPSGGYIKNNHIIVNESEEWKPFTSSFIDESFLIGYLTAEEYFYFIGELRGQNKADVNDFLKKYEEFLMMKFFRKRNTCETFLKETRKKPASSQHLLAIPM